MRLVAAALAAFVLVAAAGCGDSEAIRGGGVISGTTLTVYSVLPASPESEDVVDGAKLALYEAGGRAGDFIVNFVALDEGRAGPAEAARQAIKDAQIVAAIGASTDASAEVQVPLFNEAGVLLVSPGGVSEAFRRDPRFRPAGESTFARLVDPFDFTDGAGSIYLEHDGSATAMALADRIERDATELVTDASRADTVIYAGTEPEQAAEILTDLAREAPQARLVVTENLAAALTDRLPRAVRRRTFAPALTVSRRLPPFEDQFGRPSTSQAVVGYVAMSSILLAIRKAGAKANSRRTVNARFVDTIPSTFAFSYRLRRLGR